MRKIRIFEHVSLDGIISVGKGEHPNGDWSGSYRTPAGLLALAEAYGTGYDLLLGRHTYDLWSTFWPTVSDHPIGNHLNAATKYIITHRPDSLEWGPAKALGGDIVTSIRDLKSTSGPDLIVCGSSTLTSLLLENGLADEVILTVYPVLLGEGKRFFADGTPARELAFVRTWATPTGVLLNTYRYVGAVGA